MKRIGLPFAVSLLTLTACAHQSGEDLVAHTALVPAPASQMALPEDNNVLFWSQETRATAFRALDQIPQLAQARVIEARGETRELPRGEPIDLGGFDLDAFMQSQSSAAIVVLHDGEIVLERYGLGFSAEGRWTSFSVAKSLASTLVGAAIEDGYIGSLDDPVTQYIEDLQGSAYDGVTIRQLLTMSSGVRWDENYSDPNSDVARFINHVAEDGLDTTVSYLRHLPRANEPGTNWRYSTGETNLVGVLVTEATGIPLAEYLSQKIWTPFGMESDATWLLGATGQEIAGCCIQATTRDMARFGLFTLTDGSIDGERIVPSGWFAEATQPTYRLGDSGNGYGYQWWTEPQGAYQALGIFGQGIFIDPARDLVIATNANWPDALGSGGEGRERYRFYQAVQAAVDAQGE